MLELLIRKVIDNGLKIDALANIMAKENIKIYILLGLLAIDSFATSKKIRRQDEQILYLKNMLESETKGE